MSGRFLVACVVVLAGCLHDPTVDCGDHLCPAGAACTATGCAQPEQTAACAGRPDREPCTTRAIADGACTGEVCLPVLCGDGVTVGREACDDGNQRSADGCSADCASRETCGNGYVDALAGEQCDRGLAGLSADGCSSRCTLEVPSWHALSPQPPGPRVAPAMAYDSRRQRVVMFGGRGDQVLGETWEWDGAAWHERTPAIAPARRQDPGLAFDVARGVTVMFGGEGTAALGDTWEWDGIVWTARQPPTAPAPRHAAGMAYDPVHARTVLYGGLDAQGVGLADTWSWDGTAWTPLAPVAQPAAGAARLAFDPTSASLVLLTAAGETFTWSGTDWIRQGVAAPPLGAGQSLSRARDGVILFGGYFGGTDYRNTAVRWASGSWTAIAPGSPPTPRFAQAAAYDEATDQLVMFGGAGLATQPRDTNLLGQAAWSVAPAPGAPTGGDGPGLVYERALGTLLAFGGNLRDETWRLSDVWTQRKGGPAPSLRQAMGFAAAGDRALLFGGVGLDPGCGCVARLADTWVWDASTWTQATPALAPPAREQPAFAYDAGRDRIVLFGGVDATGALLADTWEWDGTTWLARLPAHHPPARAGGALAYDRAAGRVLLFGGNPGLAALGDTWTWDGTDWTELTPPTSPPPRGLATAAYHDARGAVILVGGRGVDELDDAWEWTGSTWALLDIAVPLPARAAAASAYDAVHQQLVVFGGTAAGGRLADAWGLRFGAVSAPPDACIDVDTDGDALAGCADPDCWGRCTPTCAVGEPCDPAAPRCGDGTCSALEDHRLCAADCP